MKNKIEFKELPINKYYGKQKYKIYYTFENDKSEVNNAFSKLNKNIKDDIKDLISKMAVNENYKSVKIKYNLKGYNYGEIRPFPHRFFFFRKAGNNYIFFYYIEKKKNKISDNVYKRINKMK